MSEAQVALKSGHKESTVIRFAFSIFSPFVGISCIGLAGQLFTIAYGADLSDTFTVLTIIAIWNTINDPIVGWMQDKELLSKYFPFQTWGRRAPWYFSHLLPNALSVGALYFVPNSMKHPADGDTAIYIWLLCSAFVMRWATSHCYTAMKSATIEIYPSSAERLNLEFWFIVFAWAAGIFAIFANAGMIADGSVGDECNALYNETLGEFTVDPDAATDAATDVGKTGSGQVLGVMFMVAVMSGLFAVPIMRQAKRKADPTKIDTNWISYMKHIWNDKASRIYMIIICLVEFHSTSSGSMYVYYVKYVSKEDQDGTAFYSSMIGVTGLISQIW